MGGKYTPAPRAAVPMVRKGRERRLDSCGVGSKNGNTQTDLQALLDLIKLFKGTKKPKEI